MRVVLPVHHFPPRYNAGAELITQRYARWLIDHGVTAEVICVEYIDRGNKDQLVVEQDSLDGIPIKRLSFNMQLADDPFRWGYDNPLIGEWSRTYFSNTTPTIVHAQGSYLTSCSILVNAHRLGIPTVLSLHDYWYICPQITLLRGDGSLCRAVPENPSGCAWCSRLKQRRYRWLNQATRGRVEPLAIKLIPDRDREKYANRRTALSRVIANVDAVIAPAPFLARQMADMINPARLHISRYGLDLRSYTNVQRRRDDSALRIGYIGQIAPHKGVHLLVQAAKQLQDAQQAIEVHIYGGLEAQPDYVRRLRALIGSDKRFQLLGRFENINAASILSNFDVTIVPSNWYEVGPLTIMESHAAGTPVIAAAIGNMPDIVRDGVDGLLFASDDADDLARQLRCLIDDAALLSRLRAGIIKPRTIDDEMNQLLAIYKQLARS